MQNFSKALGSRTTPQSSLLLRACLGVKYHQRTVLMLENLCVLLCPWLTRDKKHQWSYCFTLKTCGRLHPTPPVQLRLHVVQIFRNGKSSIGPWMYCIRIHSNYLQWEKGGWSMSCWKSILYCKPFKELASWRCPIF